MSTWEWVSQDNERWCVQPANEGGYYLHPAYAYGQAGKANLCLDLLGSDVSNGVAIWSCNGRKNQRWDFTGANQSGGFIYSMVNTGRRLKSPAQSGEAPGSPMNMATWSPDDSWAGTQWQ